MIRSRPGSAQARPQPRAGLRRVHPRAAGHGGLLLAAVLLTGLNLRGAIAAVSPVLPEVRAELALSPALAGLLTTLPVLCFAALAPAAAWVGRRIGPERTVLAGLIAIAAGTALRVLDGAPVLLAGTFLIGAAMTLGNVLLPAVVKREFPARAGSVTGLYTGALTAGAALTAALTAPLAAGWGWRGGLAAWAVLALAAAVVWIVATRGAGDPGPPPGAAAGRGGLWRSPVAWALTAVLAAQSALYYVITAWLPTVLVEDAGADLRTAALAASLFQVLGIPGTVLVPALVGRRRGQGWLGVVIAAAWAVTAAGLLAAPAAWPVWVTVGGLAQGAGISLAFTLVVLRAADEDAARRLSSMSQLVGYGVGALGPLAAGGLYAATGGWTTPLLLLVALSAGMAAAALAAGRPVTVRGKGLPRGGSSVPPGR